jgi:hypothetical protein
LLNILVKSVVRVYVIGILKGKGASVAVVCKD